MFPDSLHPGSVHKPKILDGHSPENLPQKQHIVDSKRLITITYHKAELPGGHDMDIW